MLSSTPMRWSTTGLMFRLYTGHAEGVLVTAYEPVGQLPPGWTSWDLENVASLLSCRSGARGFGVPGVPGDQLRRRDGRRVKTVTEWRILAEATSHASIPAGWVLKGSGSSVGRPLVLFQSPWLDAGEDSFVQVEVGNNYDLPTASVMVVAMAPTRADKIVFPDRLWQALAARNPPLPPSFLVTSPTPAQEAGVPETGGHRRTAQCCPPSMVSWFRHAGLAWPGCTSGTPTAITSRYYPSQSIRAPRCSTPRREYCRNDHAPSINQRPAHHLRRHLAKRHDGTLPLAQGRQYSLAARFLVSPSIPIRRRCRQGPWIR